MARALTVRTDQDTLDRLKGLAAERGADYHDIARRRLQDRLRQEKLTPRLGPGIDEAKVDKRWEL